MQFSDRTVESFWLSVARFIIAFDFALSFAVYTLIIASVTFLAVYFVPVDVAFFKWWGVCSLILAVISALEKLKSYLLHRGIAKRRMVKG